MTEESSWLVGTEGTIDSTSRWSNSTDPFPFRESYLHQILRVCNGRSNATRRSQSESVKMTKHRVFEDRRTETRPLAHMVRLLIRRCLV